MPPRTKRVEPSRWYEKSNDQTPGARGADALALPKGYYQIIRRRKASYPTEQLARADIRATYPGKIIGQARHMADWWCWQVQTIPLPTQVRPAQAK